ncbi:MAG: cytochrome c biogenesis CcdA family protein [Dehalococcoidia bacterium]
MPAPRADAPAARRVEQPAIPRMIWRAVALPVIAFGTALVVALVGALITGSSPGQVNVGVEHASASAGAFLADTSALIPLGFAFGAGMVSAVNPCGFTMLPVYLGLYLGARGAERRTAGGQLWQALVVGGSVTAGFVVLFAVVGTVIGAGMQILVSALPWIGLAVGIAVMAAGAWFLSGRSSYVGVGERVGAQIGDPRQADLRGFFLFGLSYGLASLSCTLPVFLSVVGGSVAVRGPLTALGQFILYGLGMGAVILALTLSLALFEAGVVRGLRRVQPYVERAGAVLAIGAGAYIVYYWLTLGGLLASFR